MDHTDGERICREYDALLSRAFEISRGAPFWEHAGDKECARIWINGQTATLVWPRADMEYDSPYLYHDSCEFPTRLLFMTDDELAAWKSKEDAVYQKAVEASEKKRVADEQANERAMWKRLNVKYGEVGPHR